MTRPPRPNGSSRRASSAPASRPDTISASTSPARRRSVVSATWRRSSSSAITVTAWCRISRSNSDRPPVSLAATQPGLRHRALGADGQRQRAAAPDRRCVGAKPRPSPRRARSRSSAASASTASRRELAAEGALRQRRAAAVEHQRAAADERRQRAGDRVQPALGEDDPLQALLRGDRALQHGVLLVDQPRERLLGDGDERRRVRDLEERERARSSAAFTSAAGTRSWRNPVPTPRPARPWSARRCT